MRMCRTDIGTVQRKVIKGEARIEGSVCRKRWDDKTVDSDCVIFLFSLQDQNRFVWMPCLGETDDTIGYLAREYYAFSGSLAAFLPKQHK